MPNVIELPTQINWHPKLGEVVMKGRKIPHNRVRGILIENMTVALTSMAMRTTISTEMVEALILVGVLGERYIFDVLGVSREPHGRI